jgi:hypothetical protein
MRNRKIPVQIGFSVFYELDLCTPHHSEKSFRLYPFCHFITAKLTLAGLGLHGPFLQWRLDICRSFKVYNNDPDMDGLTGGDNEYGAMQPMLVAINSMLEMVLLDPLAVL